MKDIVIIGSGGFALEVEWLIERINEKEKIWNFMGFVGKEQNTTQKIVGNDAWLLGQKQEIFAVCAIGNSELRKKVIGKFSMNLFIKYPILIDPSAIISKDITIGSGSIICAGTIATVKVEIGQHVIVNLDCTVGHSAKIDDYCTLYPSVNISGNAHLYNAVEMGTGSNVIQGINILDKAIIGAGSVVIKDLPSNCTAVGTPAKPIKFN